MEGPGGKAATPPAAGWRGGGGLVARAASLPAAGWRGAGVPDIGKAEYAPRFTVGSQSPRGSNLVTSDKARGGSHVLCFSQKLDLGASAFVAKSLFHWLRGRFMILRRMLRIQFL